VVDG
jgi:hypothetical protein